MGYVAGALDAGLMLPGLPLGQALSGRGNSVNNQCGGGGCGSGLPHPGGSQPSPFGPIPPPHLGPEKPPPELWPPGHPGENPPILRPPRPDDLIPIHPQPVGPPSDPWGDPGSRELLMVWGPADPCQCCNDNIHKAEECEWPDLGSLCELMGTPFVWPSARGYCCMWVKGDTYNCDVSYVRALLDCAFWAFGSWLGRLLSKAVAKLAQIIIQAGGAGRDVLDLDWASLAYDLIVLILLLIGGVYAYWALWLMALRFAMCAYCSSLAYMKCVAIAAEGGCPTTIGTYVHWEKFCNKE